jgi:hypothetical protein
LGNRVVQATPFVIPGRRENFVWDIRYSAGPAGVDTFVAVDLKRMHLLGETTAATTTAATISDACTSAPANPVDLGPATYRPGATPDTAGLVLYAVISVHGRLTIVAATPDDAPAHTLHRRTDIGQMRRRPSVRASFGM